MVWLGGMLRFGHDVKLRLKGRAWVSAWLRTMPRLSVGLKAMVPAWGRFRVKLMAMLSIRVEPMLLLGLGLG